MVRKFLKSIIVHLRERYATATIDFAEIAPEDVPAIEAIHDNIAAELDVDPRSIEFRKNTDGTFTVEFGFSEGAEDSLTNEFTLSSYGSTFVVAAKNIRSQIYGLNEVNQKLQI